jgi:hypothetical protein
MGTSALLVGWVIDSTAPRGSHVRVLTRNSRHRYTILVKHVGLCLPIMAAGRCGVQSCENGVMAGHGWKSFSRRGNMMCHAEAA